MQGQSPLEELPPDRFEDATDMLDFVFEKIDNAIYLWVLWSKTFASHDEQDALKAVLEEIVSQESDNLYKNLIVEIKNCKDVMPTIQGIMHHGR